MPELAFAILLPTLAALLAVPLGRHARHLALPCALLSVWVAARIALAVPTELALGGFAPPLGIRIRADGLAAAMLLMTALVSAAAALHTVAGLASATEEQRQPYAFWPLFHAAHAAVAAMFLLADLFSLYVALELLTIAAVGLVLLPGTDAAVRAAMRYLLFALAGSLAYLLGVVLLFAGFGTLDLDQLQTLLHARPAVSVSAAVISIGLLAKSALFPLHVWLPPAHAAAPAPASAILSALVVKASAILLLRLWFGLFEPLGTAALWQGAGALGSAAVLWASWRALRQARLKMIIAYSTVAQLGYLLLALPLAHGPATVGNAGNAWSAAMIQALFHGLAKAAMFLAAGAVMRAAGSDALDRLDGVGKAAPMASFAFALAGLSIMGLPPSGGFLAKYLMLGSSLASGQWWWTLPLIGGGLMAAGYVFRPIERMVRARPAGEPALTAVPLSAQLSALSLALLSVLFGLAAVPIHALLQVGAPGFIGAAR